MIIVQLTFKAQKWLIRNRYLNILDHTKRPALPNSAPPTVEDRCIWIIAEIMNNNKKKKLTWSCLTCGLRHLLAGITSTFMIWILEPRARCLAAISRSANKNQPIIYTYVTSYSRCFHIELSELYTTPQPCDHRTWEYDLFPKLGLHWRRFSRLVENLEHFDVACILQITCRCANRD